jgi:1-acyl-sn-glycerol-3-phosphate acyltransferase
MMKTVIAIDGPSGSGKSTLARALAERLGLDYLDTGAMYRCVALAALRAGIALDDPKAVSDLAHGVEIDVGPTVIVDGQDVTEAIRTPEVTRAASLVAAIPEVRKELVRRQRDWVSLHKGGVCEGRDIGSVVLPDATLKLYLVARADERARRRAAETGHDEKATAEDMALRDDRDSRRAISPLVKTPDAHEIDTTGRAVDEVVEEVIGMLERHRAPASGSDTSSVRAKRAMTVLEHRQKVVYRPPTRASLVFFSACRAIAATVCRLYCRVTVEGRDNLPTSGPYVLAPVHRSYVDWIVLGCISRRRIRFMAKDTLWRSRFVGWLLEALGTFPVHRGSADRSAFSMCVRILSEGEPCVIFPEGQRCSGPVVEELFDGAAYVAARAGVPLVPVGIGGSERVMPKGSYLPKPFKVHIVIGKPIEVGNFSGRVPRRVVKEATASLRSSIQELFDRAQSKAGVAAGRPTRL